MAKAVGGDLLRETDRVRAVVGVHPQRKASPTAPARAHAAFDSRYPDLTAARLMPVFWYEGSAL